MFFTISSALVFKPDFSLNSAFISASVLFKFSSTNSSLCEVLAFSSFKALSFSTVTSLLFLCSLINLSRSSISLPILSKSSPASKRLVSSIFVSFSISASSLSIFSKSVCTEADEFLSSFNFSTNPAILFDILFFSIIRSWLNFLLSSISASISFLFDLNSSSLSLASL